MPVQNFTDTWLNGLKTDKTIEIYHDAQVKGLSIRVSKTGKRTWQVLYRVKGDPKKKVVKLGEYPALKLRDARSKANGILSAAREGQDPLQADREARKAPTVEWLAKEYLEKYARPKKRSWEEDKRILDLDVLPAWGKRKASSIKRRDVIALLDEILARAVKNGQKGIQANRTLACVRKMFNWAISRDLIEANPCAQVQAPATETQKDRVLSEEEIRKVWGALDSATPNVATAIRLMLVTAQRKGEVLAMRWEEVDGDWWTIPAERAKNGLSHRVYLSPLAKALIESRKNPKRPSQWVFPSRMKQKQDEPITAPDDTVKAIRKDTKVSFTLHDLRRTAASHMTGMGLDRYRHVAKVLNHVEPGVTSVYDRHGYDAEKREALEAWSKRLFEILTPQNQQT